MVLEDGDNIEKLGADKFGTHYRQVHNMLRMKHWQTDKDWQNQKFRVEAEFLKNRIDHSVNISVFELEAAEHKIMKKRAAFVFCKQIYAHFEQH